MVQSVFIKNVQSLTAVIQYNMDNTLLEESNDIMVLDTKYFMESVARTVMEVKTIGQDQYSKFVDGLLSKCVAPVTIHCPRTNDHSSRPQHTISVAGRQTTAWVKCRCIALC